MRLIRVLALLALPAVAYARPTPLPEFPAACVNEVHFLPRREAGDANRDGRVNLADQFVEVVNATSSPLDVSGWTLAAAGRRRFAFPAGTTLPPGGAALVFRGGAPDPLGYGTAQVFIAGRGELRLGSTRGRIALADATGADVDRRGWRVLSRERRQFHGTSWRRDAEPDPVNGLFATSAWSWIEGPATPGRRVDGTDFAPPPEVAHVVVKTPVLNFDPIVEPSGGKRTHEVYGWADAHVLADGYAAAVASASGGYVEHQIVEWADVDEYPAMIDGFVYTDESFASAWAARTPYQPNETDYRKLIADHGVAPRVKSGEVDEVWLFGFPYAGYFESCMAGPGAYWVNGSPLPDVDSGRKFVLMGFNYERGVPEMLHDLGHRTESILSHVYGSWNQQDGGGPKHDWDRYTQYDLIAPGNAACGTTHFPPNGTRDYDYYNPAEVPSTCDDWLANGPYLTGATTQVSGAAWAPGPYELWWLSHLPKKPSVNPVSRKQDNWWKYVADFNHYPESR